MADNGSDAQDDGESPASLGDLVRRIANGDGHAETRLFAIITPGILATLRVRTRGHTQLAEDLAQDTCAVILKRLRGNGIDNPDAIAAFAHRTAVNLLTGHYRKEARRKTTPDNERVDAAGDDALSAPGKLMQAQASETVRRVIDELSQDRDRKLLHYHFIDELPKVAICRILGLSSRHFDRVKSRALKRFGKLYPVEDDYDKT